MSRQHSRWRANRPQQEAASACRGWVGVESVYANTGGAPDRVRVAKEAHTDLEPEAPVLTPHSRLNNFTSTNPGPPLSMTGVIALTGTVVELSRTVSSTTPFVSERVKTNGVPACNMALVASSLATNRTSSTRYRRSCATRC